MPAHITSRPELAEPTRQLVERTRNVHEKGGGDLDVKILTNVLGKISASDQQKIAQRGNLTLTKKGDNWGRFENTGPAEISVNWSGATLKIPKRVAGTYVVVPGESRYILDAGATLSGCQWILCVGVERITATYSQLAIDLEGDSYDQVFTF